MKIRAKVLTGLLAGLLAVSATGCGIVKVIPKGTEAEYTGQKTFDASEEADEDWNSVVEEVTKNAQDLSAVAANVQAGESYSVKFTGKATEYNTDTPKGYLAVQVDGVEEPVQVGVGSVITGTAMRDCQSLKSFADFTNQTEWSEYGRELNQKSIDNVISKSDISKDTVGKTVEVVGCLSLRQEKLWVTAVSITVE